MDGQKRVGRPEIISIMILKNSLNATRCGKLFNSEMNTYSLMLIKRMSSVIMSLTRRQSAWVNSPSETKRSAFLSSKCSASNNFNNWLVGVTDGDGCFYFNKTKNGSWTFSWQIAQSSYNLRLLYFIKSKLKIGTVNVSSNKKSMALYRVRNRTHLIKYILPIFDDHLLLTSKYFTYNFFRKAILIANDSNITKEEKNLLLSNLKLKSIKLPKSYISPAWAKISYKLRSKNDAKRIVSKAWLIGFVEAEGSFYIVKKDSERLTHAFEITQKLDFIVLKAIAIIFDLKVTKKKTYFTVVTTNSKAIKKISDYFFKTMKGMKSLEYRVWARSFNKRKRGFEYLLKIRDLMRNIRSIRFDKNYKM